MKKKLINVLLFICIILVSYFSANMFGRYYDHFFYSGSSWIGSDNSWNFIIGFPLSMIFYLTLLSYDFVFKSLKSIFWLILPLIVWEIAVDVRHIYVPILLFIVALGLNFLVRYFFKKIKHPNPPMIIK